MTVASFARARRGNRYLRFYLTRSHRRRATCRLSGNQEREAKPQRPVLFSPTINILPQSPPPPTVSAPRLQLELTSSTFYEEENVIFYFSACDSRLGRELFQRAAGVDVCDGATLKGLLPGCFCSSHLHVEPSYFCSAGTDFA